MGLVTINGRGVVSGTIGFTRRGAWHAQLDVDTADDIGEHVTIDIADGALTLVGTVNAGDLYQGLTRVRVVAGADGLRKLAKPQHYFHPTFRTPLQYLLRTAGEALSPTADAGILSRSLNAWTVLKASIGGQLEVLVSRAAPASTAWRMLPDGTLWIGAETWPDAQLEAVRELDRNPNDGWVEVGMDAPLLLAGTMLGDDKIDRVEHTMDGQGRVTARYWTVNE